MTIRQRTLVLLGASVAVMVAALWVLMSAVTLRSLERLERQDMAVDIQRASRALQESIAELHLKSADWATWDDTWRYAVDRNKAYLISNTTDQTFLNLHVDALVIADPRGRIIFAKQVDRAKATAVPIYPSLLKALNASPSLVRFKGLKDSHHGILM